MNFYQKFGFKVMGEVLIPKTDINIWILIKRRKGRSPKTITSNLLIYKYEVPHQFQRWCHSVW